MLTFDKISDSIGPGEFNYSYNISLKHKYLYVENAKAACTTVKHILGQVEFAHTNLGYDIPNVFYQNVHTNVIGTPFVKPFQLTKQQFESIICDDSFTRFTIVRNPFVRILSAYLDKVCRKLEPASEIYQTLNLDIEHDITFAEFLLAIQSRMRNEQPLDKHWRAQSVQCPRACRLNKIGRVENLERDLGEIMRSAGVELTKIEVMDGHQTNARIHLNEYYTEECIGLVLSNYADDFSQFGYQRKLPEYD